MINALLLIVFIILARQFVLHITSVMFRRLTGIALGSILLALVATEIIPFSIVTFSIAFPGSIYLALLPDRLESRGKTTKTFM